jgi:hypothetical protein
VFEDEEIYFEVFLLYPTMKGDLLTFIKGEKAEKFSEIGFIMFLILMIYDISNL